MPGALDGVRILDLSWGIAGPLGVLLLAEQGADVIKVEPPGGDPFRAYDGYRVWNRSRRSVTLDLKSEAGRADFEHLLGTADVLVESFRPGVMERLGFGFDDVRARHERLIYLSCPAYPPGHRFANRPGYDALVQASSGQMWEQPGWRMGPIFLHMPMPSMGAFYLISTGVLGALIAREKTGRGQHVTTSLYAGALLYTTQIWQHVEHATAQFHELMGKSYPPGIHQQMIFECADGWVHASVMSGLTPTLSQDEILGLEAAPDPFTFMALPAEEREKFNERRREKFKEWKRDEVVAAFQQHNHAIEAIISPDEQFAHPQLIANDMVKTVVDPVVGETTQIGTPLHMFGTPTAIQGPQPLPGQHNDEVLRDLSARAAASAPARPLRHALEGVRLIDFGQYLAGPFGPMIIGDMGADVIKVEPVTGDSMRLASKPFFGCQRGKRDIALNVKDPRGKEIALALVKTADIVHHNMTAGVATKLGIDYTACKAVKPDVVYCNTWAYGLEGPLARFGGLDPLYQASSGLEYESGAVHEGNAPIYYRFGMCDASNAMLSVVAVLGALYHRDRTGEGQEVWTSLFDGGAIYTSDAHLVNGEPAPRLHLDKDLTGLAATYRLYRTQDDDWICIAAVTDEQFGALCDVLGVGEIAADERFATRAGRLQHRRQLETILEPRFRTKTAVFWSRTLDDAGVPNEIPLDTRGGEIPLFDADNVELGLVARYPHPVLGDMRQFGQLIDFSDTPGRINGPPPLVGANTRAILRELGHRDGDIDALIAAGVCYEPDEHYRERFAN